MKKRNKLGKQAKANKQNKISFSVFQIMRELGWVDGRGQKSSSQEEIREARKKYREGRD